MLNKLTMILVFSCLLMAKLPKYNVDESILYRANVLNITYVEPACKGSNLVMMQERNFLLKLKDLLTEVEEGEHPSWRAEKILTIAEEYVDMNKVRKRKLDTLRELIKLR